MPINQEFLNNDLTIFIKTTTRASRTHFYISYEVFIDFFFTKGFLLFLFFQKREHRPIPRILFSHIQHSHFLLVMSHLCQPDRQTNEPAFCNCFSHPLPEVDTKLSYYSVSFLYTKKQRRQN